MLNLIGFISENKTKQNFAAEIGTHLVFCYKVLVSYWRINSPMSSCIAQLLYAQVHCVSHSMLSHCRKKSLSESRVSCTLKNSRMNNERDPTNGIKGRTAASSKAWRLNWMVPFHPVFFQKY